MIDYYDIPFIFTNTAGINSESEFNDLLARECGDDENKHYEFMCKWIREWLRKNKIKLVLAKICEETELAEFMCFVADFIDCFDYNDIDAISDYAFHFGGRRIEVASQKIDEALLKGSNSGCVGANFKEILDIDAQEEPDYETILGEELKTLTNEQLLELLSTVFGDDSYDKDDLPDLDDSIAFFVYLLDLNGWRNDTFTAIVEEIRKYKNSIG